MQPRSFLEFCFHRLLGRPTGTACWRCPACDSSHASLSVRPPKEGYAVKFKCFRCSWWGDEFDLFREFFPGENFPRLRIRAEEWKADYEAELADSSFTSGGGEFQRNDLHFQSLALHELLSLFETMESTDTYAFQIIGAAIEICEKHQVDPREVLKDWRRYFTSKVWWDDIEKQVAAVMKHDDANGFPVMTRKNGRT